MARKRKIPLRKCIVSNEMKPKEDMIRIVRNKEGQVFIDPTGKQNGRGAYLSKDLAVIKKAQETDALSQQFQTKVDPSTYEELKEMVAESQNES